MKSFNDQPFSDNATEAGRQAVNDVKDRVSDMTSKAKDKAGQVAETVSEKIGQQRENAADTLGRADALLFGRVTYQMMESAWRPSASEVGRPEWMEPFARTISAARKYVVSSTLEHVDWNAELVRGDLGEAVRQLKQEPGEGLYVGGVTLPLALAELGLIDEYELVVHPRIAGHGPALFAGLSRPLDLKLVSRLELDSGAVATTYVPRT